MGSKIILNAVAFGNIWSGDGVSIKILSNGTLAAYKAGPDEPGFDPRIEKVRKHGAAQEREEILAWLDEESKTQAGSGTFYSYVAERIRSRGSAERDPRSRVECTCGAWLAGHGAGHANGCPCYEPPKKVCTCGGDNLPLGQGHYPGCPCYVAPAKPLEKVDIVKSNGAGMVDVDTVVRMASSINALVDAVRELQGRKS